jgi:hypothetical protein
LEGQKSRPLRQFQQIFEGFQAPDALALKWQNQLSLDQKLVVHGLDLQIIPQRLFRPTHFILQLELELGDGQFALDPEIVLVQMAQIHSYWHSCFNLTDLTKLTSLVNVNPTIN